MDELGKVLWRKPSGMEMETNDRKETVEYCESLGWERLATGEPDQEPEAVVEEVVEAPAEEEVEVPEASEDAPEAPVDAPGGSYHCVHKGRGKWDVLDGDGNLAEDGDNLLKEDALALVELLNI